MECVFNPGKCFSSGLDGIQHFLLGWVPDWLWALAPYWWVPAGLLVIGVVWKFAGWPGLLALSGTVGVALGWKLRGDVDASEHFPNGHPDPKPVAKAAPKPAPKPKPKTLADLFKSRS